MAELIREGVYNPLSIPTYSASELQTICSLVDIPISKCSGQLSSLFKFSSLMSRSSHQITIIIISLIHLLIHSPVVVSFSFIIPLIELLFLSYFVDVRQSSMFGTRFQVIICLFYSQFFQLLFLSVIVKIKLPCVYSNYL